MPLPEEFHDLARKVNNWGRWGEDDERGTLNLITPEVVQRAAACVRHGRTFSLAIPLSVDGPQTGAIPGRSNPVRTMLTVNEPFTGDESEVAFSDDVVFMGLQAATHWDSLGHVSYDGRMYNGHPTSSVSEQGAAHLGIDRVGPLVSRGVLLDVARSKGVARLEGGYGITRAYARSKLANVLFTTELARRLAGTGVTANCLHPGVVATNIWSHAPGYVRFVLPVAKLFMLSAEKGADTIVYLAANPEIEGLTGGYYERNRKVTPSPLAGDHAIPKRLWDRSAALVGLPL